MNVEIGTEAAQFSEKEYINGIAVAVHWKQMHIGKHEGNNSLGWEKEMSKLHIWKWAIHRGKRRVRVGKAP